MASERLGPDSWYIAFRAGDIYKKVFRIISGKVEFPIDTTANRLVLAILCAGEIFGEIGMIAALPRPAAAVASGATVVEIISKKDFTDSIGSNEALRFDYLSSLFNRLGVTSSKVWLTLNSEASSDYSKQHDLTLDQSSTLLMKNNREWQKE